MGKHIDTFKNFKGKFDDKLDDMIKSNKETLMRSIMNRSNLMLNKYDKIDWSDENLLKIRISYFDYGQGTKILPILKHKTFYFDYWIDFKNRKLIEKNLLGGTHYLTVDELDLIYNKYFWFKK